MTGNPWDAEVTLAGDGVQRLLSSQFPALPLHDLRLLAEGWDNAVWVVNDEWAFRFPRVSGAVAYLQTEIAVLPHLAPLLPLPIPVPEFVGRPDDLYPWPCAGARLIPGRELVSSGLNEQQRVAAARQLGAFLRCLHDTPPGKLGPALPSRPERSDAARGIGRDVERLQRIGVEGIWDPPAEARELVEQAAAVGSDPKLVVSHGDLHVRHLLVGAAGQATGVIDWGEVSRLHPSIDLHIAYSGFAGAARDALFGEYGPIPEEWATRARASALLYSVTLALYARQRNEPDLEREAVAGIMRVMVS